MVTKGFVWECFKLIAFFVVVVNAPEYLGVFVFGTKNKPRFTNKLDAAT